MFEAPETDKQLLIVEQSGEKRQLLTTFFSKAYSCDEADSIDSALSKIRANEYAVILAAIIPPQLNGLELIPYLKTLSPRTIPVFMSEGEAAGNTIKAFRAGAFDVIRMPMSLKRVESAVEKAFVQYEVKCLKDRYKNQLEEQVFERIVALDHAHEAIENSYRMTLKALVQALAARELEPHGHCERMVTFSLRLGHELGLEKEAMRDLELGALLHDIGKIGIPDSILTKPGTLDGAEWAKMKLHPLHGQKILQNIPFLAGASRIVAQHHEAWDGSGYPLGLRGEDIHIGARICSVIDAFDSMTTDRVYRKGGSYEDSVRELEKYAGTQFDPMAIEAFRRVPREDWEILRKRSLVDKHENRSFQEVVSELVYSGRQLELVH